DVRLSCHDVSDVALVLAADMAGRISAWGCVGTQPGCEVHSHLAVPDRSANRCAAAWPSRPPRRQEMEQGSRAACGRAGSQSCRALGGVWLSRSVSIVRGLSLSIARTHPAPAE